MREDDAFVCSLSGLQHFSYCPRQWALIELEKQWADNVHTVSGSIFHQNAHEGLRAELRGDVLIVRQMEVRSELWHLHGICDVVEFYRSGDGIALFGRQGLWKPVPVEYKKGRPTTLEADSMQLCAQAVCLEEMLCCQIPEAYLYYGEPRKREEVILNEQLRDRLRHTVKQMRELSRRRVTPQVKKGKACRGCSFEGICLPKVTGGSSAAAYLQTAILEGE